MAEKMTAYLKEQPRVWQEIFREMLIDDLRGYCRQVSVCMPGTSALDCAVKLAMKYRTDEGVHMPGPGWSDRLRETRRPKQID